MKYKRNTKKSHLTLAYQLLTYEMLQPAAANTNLLFPSRVVNLYFRQKHRPDKGTSNVLMSSLLSLKESIASEALTEVDIIPSTSS